MLKEGMILNKVRGMGNILNVTNSSSLISSNSTVTRDGEIKWKHNSLKGFKLQYNGE